MRYLAHPLKIMVHAELYDAPGWKAPYQETWNISCGISQREIVFRFLSILAKNNKWLRELDISSCKQIQATAAEKLLSSLPLLGCVHTRYLGAWFDDVAFSCLISWPFFILKSAISFFDTLMSLYCHHAVVVVGGGGQSCHCGTWIEVTICK